MRPSLHEPERARALTLLIPVLSERSAELGDVLVERAASITGCLAELGELHSGRVLLLPAPAAPVVHLLIETSFDGDPAKHLDRLDPVLGPHWTSLGPCLGAPRTEAGPGLMRALADRFSVPAQAFYAGHALAVAEVERGRRLHRRVDGVLGSTPRWGTRDPRGVARELRACLGEEGERSMSPPPRAVGDRSALGDGLVAPALALRLLGPVLLSSLLARARGAAVAPRPERALPVPGPRAAHTPVTAVFPLLPGRVARNNTRAVLALIDAAGATGGRAGGARLQDTFHFARFVLLPGALLYLGDHDVDWRTRLGCAPTPLAAALAALFAQTAGSPSGLFSGLVRGRYRERIERWVDAFSVPAQIWYSAYADLTVNDVLRNHRLRELFASDLSADQAAELCALL